MTPFGKIQTQNYELSRVQDNVANAFAQVLGNPLTSGQVVGPFTLAVGSNTVSHGLGRPLTGWIQIRSSAATSLYDAQKSNTNSGQTLLLNSSAISTVSLFVF